FPPTRPPPPRSTLFPYTTLFRSLRQQLAGLSRICGIGRANHGASGKPSEERLPAPIAPNLPEDRCGGNHLHAEPACGGEACPHRSEEHTSELQSRSDLVCRLLLE